MAGMRLQSRLVAAVLVAGGAGAVHAQEADWTGFYAGVHADYLWGEPTVEGNSPTIDPDIDGFGGGAAAGFNYQFDQFLLGVEADITAFDTDGEVFNFK